MADPEQIYQEVLQEEQGKGSSGPVAEGRAKAARARAEHGSPHPKEAKWWPGAQPHLEGGGATEAPAAEPEEAAAEPEPAPEPEAAPAPAAEAPAAVAEAPAEAPAPAPAVEQPAAVAQAPAPAAAATPTQLAPEDRPPGVTHGISTGTRLRPEDESTTEAQFDGEAAVKARRKLIDDLVASGVPAVAASEAGGPRSPWLAVLYLLIPFLAIAFLIANNDDAPAAGGGEEVVDEGGGGGGGLSVTAANVAFDTDTLTLTAGEPTTISFSNDDSQPHNIAIYPTADDASAKSNALFQGEVIEGGASIDYEVGALEAGEYPFQCDIHPAMAGTTLVE